MKKTKPIKWKKGFKLVRPIKDPKFYSSIFQFRGGVIYVPGAPARPQIGCGPLAVFKTLRLAKLFIKSVMPFDDIKIFNCRYIPAQRRKLWVTHDFQSNNGKGTPILKHHYSYGYLPVGTDFAKCVIIQGKEINEGEKP